MSKNENITLWNDEKVIDPKHCKNVSVSGKHNFTNIDAYYLLEKATARFGAYGKGFGLKEGLSIEEVHLGDTILIKLNGIFFYEGGEFPVFNALKLMYKTSKGYDKVDEEAYKKIITNTIGKALSYLGFGADVYMGKFEDATYLQEITQDFALEEYNGYLNTIKEYIDKATEKEKVTKWVLDRAKSDDIAKISYESAKEIAKLITQKMKKMS